MIKKHQNMCFTRYILLCTIICQFNSVLSQKKIPVFPEYSKTIDQLIPFGWMIDNSISGDFNNDSLIDIAIVSSVRDRSSGYILNRYLIIALKISDDKFQLNLTSNKIFGNNEWGLQGNDPFDELNYADNKLNVKFFTGGTLHFSYIYSFILENSTWVLSDYFVEEYDIFNVDQNGNIIDYCITEFDLLNKQRTKYDIKNGTKTNIERVYFNVGKISLQEIDATGGMDWE